MHQHLVSIILSSQLHISPCILTNAVVYGLLYLTFSGAKAQTNVWRVLDRIIAATYHMMSLNPLPSDCAEVNPSTGCLTIWHCAYRDSCGFTPDVCTELFLRRNSAKREALAVNNVQFMNVEQHYKFKKMQICVLRERSSIPDHLLYDPVTPMARSGSCSTPSMSQDTSMSQDSAYSSEYSSMLKQDMLQQSILTSPSGNGRHLTFYKIPKRLGGTEQSKENFLRNIPQSVFETMLADAGGTVSQGVELFVERLYKIDGDAALAGMRSGRKSLSVTTRSVFPGDFTWESPLETCNVRPFRKGTFPCF
jgi:hypothetical protein